MKAKSTYLFSFFLLWLTLFSGGLSAQPYLGVVWEKPEDATSITATLDSLEMLGVRYVELQAPIDDALLSEFEAYNFTVFVRSNQHFLIRSDLEQNSGEISSSLSSLINQTNPVETVSGIGLLTNSLTEDDDFYNAFSPILSTLSSTTENSFYFVKGLEWFTFENRDDSFGVLFTPSGDLDKDLFEFHEHFDRFVQHELNQILFVESGWLLSAVSEYPPLAESLAEFDATGSWLFPVPEQKQKQKSTNLLVILLLVMWTGLVAQIKYLPYVKPMMVRYFLAHRFFIDDILQYRERVAAGSVIMMIMHAIFGGMVCYISARILVSEAGLEALFYHYPILSIAGNTYFSLFLVATIVVLLTQILAIIWLHLPAKKLDHLSQTINLYAGLLYLDFILITIMVPLFLTNTLPLLSVSLSVIYVLIWFSSFNITAFSASRVMGGNRFVYLLITIGLHSVLFVATMLLILFYTDLFQVLKLSLSI